MILPEGHPEAAWRPPGASWAAIEPLFEKQMAFNAAIVEHLNRNVAAHRDAHAALERALPALRDGFDALQRFESLLVQFLQTITPLADTHYREIDDAIAQLRAVTDVAQRTAMLAKREVERRAASRCSRCTRVRRVRSAHECTRVHLLHPMHRVHLISTSASKIAFADRKPRSARGSTDYVAVLRGSVRRARCRMRPRRVSRPVARARAFAATGLDLNPEMVEVCRARGLDADGGRRAELLAGPAG